MMDAWSSFLLGIIEGLTEFLPISSTAHLIVGEKILGIPDNKFLHFYTVFIQLGAIAAVPILYWRRLLAGTKIYGFILASFIPAAVFGVLLDDYLEALFSGFWFIVASWFLGGLVLIKIDDWLKLKESNASLLDELSIAKSLRIGLFQCLAMIPGVSRSGASIVGARILGLSHRSAVEYSFLLGIPTILGASAKKLWDYRADWGQLSDNQALTTLGIGFVVSFVIALISIRFLVAWVSKKGFRVFGYYRVAAAILLAMYLWNQ